MCMKSTMTKGKAMGHHIFLALISPLTGLGMAMSKQEESGKKKRCSQLPFILVAKILKES